jgi:hypothetical protein
MANKIIIINKIRSCNNFNNLIIFCKLSDIIKNISDLGRLFIHNNMAALNQQSLYVEFLIFFPQN